MMYQVHEPLIETTTTECYEQEDEIIITVHIVSSDVIICIIHFSVLNVLFVSGVSDYLINPTASSTNNTPKKNGMKEWMKYLAKWKQIPPPPAPPFHKGEPNCEISSQLR
jgi:hypothetical protein